MAAKEDWVPRGVWYGDKRFRFWGDLPDELDDDVPLCIGSAEDRSGQSGYQAGWCIAIEQAHASVRRHLQKFVA